MADGWLSSLLGYHRLKDSLNNVFPQRSTLKVIGGTLTDDEEGKQTVLEVTGGGGPLSYGSPSPLVYGGAGADGIATAVARADHVHPLAAPSGGSGVWDARVAPSGLHASSDNFSSDTIGSGKWTKWDPNTFFSGAIDTSSRRMVLTSDGSIAPLQWGGYYQACPSTLFTVLAYVSVHGLVGTGAPAIGLMVGDMAAEDFISCDFTPQRSGTSGGIVERTVTSATSAGTATVFNITGPTGIWACLRVDATGGGTSVQHDYSSDGKNWSNFRSDRSMAGVVPHMGIVFGKSSNSAIFQACVEYFRVFDGTATFGAVTNGGFL